MNGKIKGLTAVIIICALLASLYGTTLVVSAPRSSEGPLGTNQGFIDLQVNESGNSTRISIVGYRQVTIYIRQVGFVGSGDAVNIAINTRLNAGDTEFGSPIETISYLTNFDFPTTIRTYQVQGDTIWVRITYSVGYGTFRVAWYLTA